MVQTVLDLVQLLVFPGILFLLFYALLSEWVSRKFAARLQNRVGPLHTGWKGILQPLADIIKLLAKEDITPAAADRTVFALAPILIFALPLAALLVIPIQSIISLWSYDPVVSFEGDLIIVLFLMALVILFVFLGGWSSSNRFGAVGATRAALQMLSYEIPLGLAAIGPAIFAGSLSISRIVDWQVRSFTSFVTAPSLSSISDILVVVGLPFTMIIGFGIFTICLLAELEMRPFDTPEAETEIVGGWQVEYSGKKLGLLVLGRDVRMVLAAALLTSLFLGGAAGPWPVPPVIWFVLKTVACVFVLSNLSVLLARYRIDQMLKGSWKYLVPLAIVQVMAVVSLTGLM